jgi:hypothetical protein
VEVWLKSAFTTGNPSSAACVIDETKTVELSPVVNRQMTLTDCASALAAEPYYLEAQSGLDTTDLTVINLVL